MKFYCKFMKNINNINNINTSLFFKSVFVREKPSLPGGVHVRLESPLRVRRLGRVHGAQLDLIEPQLEPRPHLLQIHVLASVQLLVVVVPERHKVVVVGKGHHALRIFLGYRKEVLENGHGPDAELTLEVVEDEVRVGLGHGADVGDVVPHDDVRHGEVGGGAVGKMANHQAVGHTAVLLYYQKIRYVICSAGIHKLLKFVCSSV